MIEMLAGIQIPNRAGEIIPMDTIIAAFGIGVVGLVAILLLVAFVKAFLIICPPNEVLIISGKKGVKTPDGRSRGFATVTGGLAFRIPGFQRIDRMSLNVMEVPIAVRNAYSQGGIAMNIDAIANVKISSDDRLIGNAVERFQNRDVAEIRRVAKETLEGHLRGVVANLTPEQVNEDRLVFAEAMSNETESDLNKLGLHLDTLKILHVADETGYLDATGRKAIANVLRSAEIAESDAQRQAEQAEAENLGRANVTRANTDAKIAQLRNEFRTMQADLDANVKAEEERTLAAAREARAKAEQELQQVRAELAAIQLQSDEILPANAHRQAEEYRARGDAALIREKGRAVADALTLLYDAWKKAGPNASQIQLIQNLETILATASQGVHKVQVEGVNIIDSGDGKALSNYLTAYPAMLNSIFESLEQTTGIDVPGTVSGRGGQS